MLEESGLLNHNFLNCWVGRQILGRGGGGRVGSISLRTVPHTGKELRKSLFSFLLAVCIKE